MIMTIIAVLRSLRRRRTPPRVPLSESEITALAADADRFENEYAWEDPRIVYDKDGK